MVVGEGEPLQPVFAVTVAGFHRPDARANVAAVGEEDARCGEYRIGLAPHRQRDAAVLLSSLLGERLRRVMRTMVDPLCP